jgi:hypothetical protein
LLPASVPLIFILPLVGRCYDKAGTRPPMLTGYLLLPASGVVLALGGFTFNYWLVMPGLLLYGGARGRPYRQTPSQQIAQTTDGTRAPSVLRARG